MEVSQLYFVRITDTRLEKFSFSSLWKWNSRKTHVRCPVKRRGFWRITFYFPQLETRY